MPRRERLTPAQREQLLTFPSDSAELIRLCCTRSATPTSFHQAASRRAQPKEVEPGKSREGKARPEASRSQGQQRARGSGGSLAAALQRPTTYEAISFYGYVASQYPGGKHAEFEFDVWPMNEEQLAREALEQHHQPHRPREGSACHTSLLRFP